MSSPNPLKKALLNKDLLLPSILSNPQRVHFQVHQKHVDTPVIQRLFKTTKDQDHLRLKEGSMPARKTTIGVVFSGGQAPGGHNVLLGLLKSLKDNHQDSKLLGFLNGPSGLIKGECIELTQALVQEYQNLGGFNCIGSGRTKIETPEQLEQALSNAKKFNLDGFVIIGGDDSNTNAAVLAEYFKSNQQSTTVIGVPKTIDGDLKNEYVEVSFGFDTATKVYSELIGNIATDAISSKKYTHFIKLMGRSASHITLECALKTNPNLIFIGEAVQENKTSLDELVSAIATLVIDRANQGLNYAVILIPEGLIDFIPELHNLNDEINKHLAQNASLTHETIESKLSKPSLKTYLSLPTKIKEQLLLERDPHGNIQLAKIETHRLLMEMTQKKLKSLLFKGKFNPVLHYLGYEGRSAHPSPFDADYTYALGYCAGLLNLQGLTGYMACVKNLHKKVSDWDLFALPITSLLNIEVRDGKEKPVIKKALVNLNGKSYLSYLKKREGWRLKDQYNSPGPIQFFGPDEVTQIKNTLLVCEA